MSASINTRKIDENKPLVLRKTLEIIGGKWRLFIIYQIGNEVLRYGELRRMIPEVSEKVLVQELKALMKLGVVERKSYQEAPPRVEYELTVQGRQVLPTLLELMIVGKVFLNHNDNK